MTIKTVVAAVDIKKDARQVQQKNGSGRGLRFRGASSGGAYTGRGRGGLPRCIAFNATDIQAAPAVDPRTALAQEAEALERPLTDVRKRPDIHNKTE
jgi:hypothetical protein